MTRSGAYNLRSALLTPSARQEIEVKRERAASPDLQALSARPRKKQKTHASHLNADVSEASGSARHTRAHDANPRPDCLVCYPGGAPKKIKIEATVVRHTRAHDSVPHPDCDVCRLSRPSKPTRPKRHPKKASLRKTGLKKSSRVSASPTPSLAFDILSSEADTGPLTPPQVDDEPDSFEVVKESTSGRSACSFSSSLAHIQEYLSDGSTPFIAEGRNHHAYTHFSLAASDSAPLQVPQQDSHSMQHSIPPSASSAPQNLSRFRAPHDQSKGRSPPPRSDSSAFSKITMRNSAATSEVSCHLSASNSHRSTNSSAILPPRLKHKSLKVQLASSGPGSAALYYKVSGSGTNASTEPSHPMHGLPVTGSTPTSPTGRLPPPTGTQPACSSQLALTGTIGGGLQASVLSGPNQPLQPLVGLSEHPGVPRHDASYFRPLVAHTESTVSMPKKITSRLQLSSNQGFRDVYSIGSKATGPHCLSDKPSSFSPRSAQRIFPADSHATRGSTRLGLMEKVLSGPSRISAAGASNHHTALQGHSPCQISKASIDGPVSLSPGPSHKPYDPAQPTPADTTSLAFSSVAATGTPLAFSAATATSTNPRSTIDWADVSRAFPAPPLASPLTGPGVPGHFVAPRRQDPPPVSTPFKASATSGPLRDCSVDGLTSASAISPVQTLALQDPSPFCPIAGSGSLRLSSLEVPGPARNNDDRSTGQSAKQPLVSDAVADSAKTHAPIEDSRTPGTAHPGRAEARQDIVKIETPTEVIQIPPAVSPKPSRNAAKPKTLRLAYSSEDEPLIIAVKRKAALGARDKGTNTRAAVGTDKAAKSGGPKGKRTPRAAKAKIKKENGPEAELAIDNKPKGGKNNSKVAQKIKGNIDSVPPGGSSNKVEEQETKKKRTRAPRKPRKKAQPKETGKPGAAAATSSAPVFDSELEALWSGPSSLFPCPAPWTPSAAWTAQGGLAAPTDGHASMWPTDGSEPPCDGDMKNEHAGPVLMHPPRQFSYDLGSLMAYQGCRWDAEGFSGMELSALPWLASTCAPMVVDGLDGAGAKQIIDGPDFSLPAEDPNWSAYIQLLTDVPAAAWAPLGTSMEL